MSRIHQTRIPKSQVRRYKIIARYNHSHHEWWPPLTIILSTNRCISNASGWREEDYALATSTERARITSEPRYNSPQFIRPPDPTKGVQTCPFVQQMRLSVEIRRCHAAQSDAKKIEVSDVNFPEICIGRTWYRCALDSAS